MNQIISEFFADLGADLTTPYITAKQLIIILTAVFLYEVLIRLITAITDLCRK